MTTTDCRRTAPRSRSPDWSPDGNLILFRVLSARRDQHGNLYAICPDGGGLKRLTNYTAPKTVIAGSFSPDGNFITFARFTNGPDPAIFVMRADGSGVRQVTPRGAKGTGFASDWGPAR